MHTMDTPIGPFSVLLRDETVLAAGFTSDIDELLPQVHPALRDSGPGQPERIAKAVAAYFDGDLTAIDQVEVVQRSDGAFLGHAWQVLRTVPAGQPISYQRYAELAGRPAAIRAAAAACARNAVALFVPCHRVVRTDGGLGGYRWGVNVKQHLLDHEKTRS